MGEERRFVLPDVENLKQLEKKVFVKNCAIYIGLPILILLMFLAGIRTGYLIMAFLVLAAIAFLLILAPTYIITFVKDNKRTLGEIRISAETIYFGEDAVNFQSIKKVQMTAINTKPSSPLNFVPRYLWVKTDSGKKKYWLGSLTSVNNGDYDQLCKFLEEAFKEKNVNFSYSKKKPLYA